MPLLSVNTIGRAIRLPCGEPIDAALDAGLDRLSPGAPTVIMVHGFRFSPFLRRHTPHDHILAAQPGRRDRKALPWPRHLGLAGPCPRRGLGIGFGWPARGSIWQAYAAASEAGAALAGLIDAIRLRRTGPVSVIAHSLGARVALSALPHLRGAGPDRVVLLAAAEFRDAAVEAIASPTGRRTEIVNITSRENDLYDCVLEHLLRRPARSALGQGGPEGVHRWVDVQLDDPATLSALARHGYPIPEPSGRICHWSLYLRPGVFRLYRDLLTGRDRLPLHLLAAIRPTQTGHRWSRLLALRRSRQLLPMRANASS